MRGAPESFLVQVCPTIPTHLFRAHNKTDKFNPGSCQRYTDEISVVSRERKSYGVLLRFQTSISSPR